MTGAKSAESATTSCEIRLLSDIGIIRKELPYGLVALLVYEKEKNPSRATIVGVLEFLGRSARRVLWRASR